MCYLSCVDYQNLNRINRLEKEEKPHLSKGLTNKGFVCFIADLRGVEDRFSEPFNCSI